MWTEVRQFCSTHRAILRVTFIVVTIFVLRTALVYAGSDNTFEGADNLLTGWIKGSYTKAAAIIGIIATLYRTAMGGWFGEDPNDPLGSKLFDIALFPFGVIIVICYIMIALQMPAIFDTVFTGLF